MSNIISLNEFKSNGQFSVPAQIGDSLTYGGLIHASVGFFIDYSIENEAIVQYKDLQQTFHFPKRMEMEGITGADESTGIFTFQAIAAGTSKLRILHNFRGETEQELVFEIIVSN